MSALTAWLQSNPLIIVAMFVVSLLSGIIGIALGWKSFYADYLSKVITIPVWLIIVIVLFSMAIKFGSTNKNDFKVTNEQVVVEDKRFGVQQIIADGKRFRRCEFSGTEIIINGKDTFSFEHCNFTAPRFTLRDNAALTVAILTKMYGDQSFRPLIDATIANIKSGNMPEASPISTIK